MILTPFYAMNQKIGLFKQKTLISKISVDSNFTFSSYAWLCVLHCSHRLLCWIKSRVRHFFCENCSHFILKWFELNSFREVCFSEECTTNMQKIHILKNFETQSALYFTSASMPLIEYTYLIFAVFDVP